MSRHLTVLLYPEEEMGAPKMLKQPDKYVRGTFDGLASCLVGLCML